MTLSEAIRHALGSSTPTVAVSRRKLELLHTAHAADGPFFSRMVEIVEGYEYWGRSPKRADAIELYRRLDGIWFTLVIYAPGPNTVLNSLGTMHRVDRRKVDSRRRRYLHERGDVEE
jgi:hypothetical protein